MIIGSLNIREGGSSVKRRRINHIIVKGNADIFLIQETKFNSISVGTASSFWRSKSVDFSFLLSVGASGGLISLWNTYTIQVSSSFGGVGYLGLKAIWKEEVYYIVNWVIAGDFNAVKNSREGKGSLGLNRSSEWRDFSEFISLSNLVDIPSKGKKFTWFGGDGKARSRIDRFLVADNIVNKWGILGQMVGNWDISDHCPIWLICDKEDWGPKPFKANAEWFSNRDFSPFVEKEWKELVVKGRGDYVLKEKLRLLKERD
ncbi:uncharacterized protein LOC131660131 [Vicia villosa]|uniref:uncharacterized protein LOC131660131 n=1 Tax=Vicia villosa TaxID=3911 RepID=UPI00273BEBC9|nr:uncharacterized protein LOC131660131 [Vicia villosa]